jgi:hypothetical protein
VSSEAKAGEKIPTKIKMIKETTSDVGAGASARILDVDGT